MGFLEQVANSTRYIAVVHFTPVVVVDVDVGVIHVVRYPSGFWDPPSAVQHRATTSINNRLCSRRDARTATQDSS